MSLKHVLVVVADEEERHGVGPALRRRERGKCRTASLVTLARGVNRENRSVCGDFAVPDCCLSGMLFAHWDRRVSVFSALLLTSTWGHLQGPSTSGAAARPAIRQGQPRETDISEVISAMGILNRNPNPKEPARSGARPPKQVQVQLGEAEAEGIYSNLVLISHSPSEFILDFARILPGAPKAKVHARIVMTPPNAKSLLGVLQKNLENFEEKHGKIPAAGAQDSPREIGFK
jgi:hypothetical protein